MNKHNNIYLIGPMGSGKTSVGKRLAKMAGLTFYDTDSEIESRTGVTISWIFDVEKEEGFRRREEATLEALTQLHGIVLSTGGGCVVDLSNRRMLSENGFVVYLRVSLEKQLHRTSHRKGIRPLLEQSNPEVKLLKLNEEREPLYTEIADAIYETDKVTPGALAFRIFKDIQQKIAG